jgi:hypothetical protein
MWYKPEVTTAPHPRSRKALRAWLESAPAPIFVLYAIGAAFSTYFCMYAFRKPFSAGEYAGAKLGGVDLKTALVISQILGYAISKYIGIKVCSEAAPGRRAWMLVLFILWAETALVLFAVLPPAGKLVAIFLNGIPLGMVWGLVVWYLEGRRSSEVLLAGLSASYIVASGVVKDAGRYLIREFQVNEWWMPAATGLCFLPLFLLSVWLLNQIPRPRVEDVRERAERAPMDAAHRASFVRSFFPGLLLLFPAYFFLTAYRDFRDNYGVEIIRGLGYASDPAFFTKAEALVMAGVLIPIALLNLIKDNRRGLGCAFVVMTLGTVLLGASTLLHDAGRIDGFWWMTLVGLGSYLAYVPFGSILFDRLIASTRFAGTAVFAIYLADAIGYTGSVGVQLYKDFGRGELTRLGFFRGFTYFMSVLGAALLAGSCLYFLRRAKAPAPDSLLKALNPQR